MIRPFVRAAASLAVLALAACGAEQPVPAESADATKEAADSSAAPRDATSPAKLAYLVSQHSPLLSEAQRIVITQDFQGVPLSGPPAVHTVTAQKVSCRVGAEIEGAACAIAYSETQTVELGGVEARDLYDALGAAGAEEKGGASPKERSIEALSCTVDDHTAQTVPSTGDDVAGFACRFSGG